MLRHAAAVADGSDGDDVVLLRRVAASGDPAAFAALVRRYGRLVWAVCRQLRPVDADAEDAFQATFLAMLQSAGRVRTNALGPWLHTVARRVAGKAGRADARRRRREQAAAAPDRHVPVPPSAWDALAAAVHDEVARLPDHLRVPFVLCCLEGRPPSEAAKHLGWKVGTLSGRLTRAKQTLLDRLAKRGLPASAVAVAITLTTAAVPTAVAAKAINLIHRGDAIPATILELAKGATTMTKTKLLAAAVLVAAGLTASVGGWLASAEAQSPEVVREVEQLTAQFRAAQAAKDLAVAEEKAPKWEYHYQSMFFDTNGKPSGMKAADFEKLVEAMEGDGWQYLGQADVTVLNGAALPSHVFRRPKNAAAVRRIEAFLAVMDTEGAAARKSAGSPNPEVAAVREVVLQRMRKNPAETFAAALETKLKASPDLAAAVEKHGRTVLEVEVLSALLRDARRAAAGPGRRPLEDPIAGEQDDVKTLAERTADETETVRKHLQSFRDRKTVRFSAADFGITGEQLYEVVNKALQRKFDLKQHPIVLAGFADSVEVNGPPADIAWLTELLAGFKIKAKTKP
ncbi:RNA polymerase sigma factor [Limnoglobus roseus]|uniref:RNA polymerase sigma factor n=1 Tax=Limnoglobus roseus TaxID=2598579 RepID=UPI00143D2A16|nr:sigma-70 family RNA polymerase sigma factor [Limnoglobus roseus]